MEIADIPGIDPGLLQQAREELARRRKERLAAGRAARATAGRHTGPAPLGYLNAVVGGRKTIVVVEGEAVLVREADEIRKRGAPLRAIIAELTPKGLRSRNGRPIGPSSLKLMLDNPTYRGLVRDNGKLVKGDHEPLFE